MTFREFCEEYDIDIQYIHYLNYIKRPKWIQNINEKKYIDDKYLLSVAKQRQHLWLCSHEYYYYFTYVIGMSASTLSRALSLAFDRKAETWNSYFSNGLFQINNVSLLNAKISEMLSEFIEFSEYAIPRTNRKFKKNKDYLEKLEDMK